MSLYEVLRLTLTCNGSHLVTRIKTFCATSILRNGTLNRIYLFLSLYDDVEHDTDGPGYE